MAPQICPLTGKRCLTRGDAKAEASWWRRERFARMQAYRCRGHWHIGNDRHKHQGRRAA